MLYQSVKSSFYIGYVYYRMFVYLALSLLKNILSSNYCHITLLDSKQPKDAVLFKESRNVL